MKMDTTILIILVVGAIAYVYYAGGQEDIPENAGIAFVMLLLGVVLGGVFL